MQRFSIFLPDVPVTGGTGRVGREQRGVPRGPLAGPPAGPPALLLCGWARPQPSGCTRLVLLLWRGGCAVLSQGQKEGEEPQFSALAPQLLERCSAGQVPEHRPRCQQPCAAPGDPGQARNQPGLMAEETRMKRRKQHTVLILCLKIHQPWQRVSLSSRKDVRCRFPLGSPINPHVSSIYNSKKASKLPLLSC